MTLLQTKLKTMIYKINFDDLNTENFKLLNFFNDNSKEIKCEKIVNILYSDSFSTHVVTGNKEIIIEFLEKFYNESECYFFNFATEIIK
jgi:hypothetical protein